MSHVQDLWTSVGPNGRRVRSARWGKGLRWQARWEESGREKTKSFKTHDAADYHLAQMRVTPRSSREQVTVQQFSEMWQAQQLHYASSTRRSVADKFRTYILPEIGSMPVASVTRADVQRMVVKWTQRAAPATVRMAYSYLTSMFAAAASDGWCLASPCAGVNLPARVRVQVVPLTAEQVWQIADAILPWYRSMVIVGAATGLRGGELRGLTWDRVQDGDIIVNRQLVDVVDGVPVFEAPKSQAGFRRVALGEVAQAALDEHRALYPSDGLVWTTRQGGPVRRNAAERAWLKAIEGMTVRPRSGWHDLRHHHASVLIAAGLPPNAVAERLGHADPAETLRTYAHLWPSDHARMTAAADASLSTPSRSVVVPLRVVS